MGTGKDPRMRDALRLARAGEKEQARQLLIEILKHNRDDADAWVVMAQVAESHQEAVTCIKRALRLRPDDERAQRYLEFLLHQGDEENPVSLSPWLWGGLGAALMVCLAVALIFFLSRPGSQTQTGELGTMPDAQPIAGQITDCAVLIKEALEVSDQGCDQMGRDQVCYGHDTVQAQLVPGANARFDQPGNTIPINILEKFMASPLDLQKGDWGVGVFRLEANLPGTLPGQLVTLLVFGNTSVQNTSGDMHAFYFTSGLGGIRCDTVPFDGILVNMADGARFAFKANGTDIALQGNSILRAIANDSLVVTMLSGMGVIRAFGREQSFGAGQTVMVPIGGSSGLEADGPPGPPQPADNQTVNAGCTLTGQGCPGGDQVAEAVSTNTPVPIDPSIPTNTPAPLDPSIPTNTPVPVAPGQPTNTSVPLPTNTPAPLPTNTPAPVKTATPKTSSSGMPPTPTNTTQPAATPTRTPTPTSTLTPTATTLPPTATTPPPTATTPPPPTATEAVTLSGSIYLHNEPSPPSKDTASHNILTMNAAVPSAGALYNYDTDRDSFAGLMIKKGASGAGESDLTKIQRWRSGTFGVTTTINGAPQLVFWSAMKDFTSDKGGNVTAYLAVTNGGTTAWSVSGNVQSSPWGGAWMQKTLSFGAPGSSIIPAGYWLELVLIVSDSSGDDMWFAYDTTGYQTRVIWP